MNKAMVLFLFLTSTCLSSFSSAQDTPEEDIYLICTSERMSYSMLDDLYIRHSIGVGGTKIFTSEVSFINRKKFESWDQASVRYSGAFEVNRIVFTNIYRANSDLGYRSDRWLENFMPKVIQINRTTTEFSSSSYGRRDEYKGLKGECASYSLQEFLSKWSRDWLIDGDTNERQKGEIRSNRAF
jgi:hypothetical protein